MVLKISETTLCGVSVALICCTTLAVSIPIFQLFRRTRHLGAWERPTLACWFYAHRMQNYLALANLVEIVFLLAGFPLVVNDRYYLCHAGLSAESCESLAGVWRPIAACLLVDGIFCGLAFIILSHSLSQRIATRRNRQYNVLNNRPYYLAAAHYLLQASALATVIAAFTSAFFQNPPNPRAALITSIVTGTFAVALFLLGTYTTFWGIAKYHYSMRSVRREARSKRLMWATEVDWLFYSVFRGHAAQIHIEREVEVLLQSIESRQDPDVLYVTDVWVN
ncbi:MAG: hypothetical protein Q9185_004989 [Variospora sp. 1 TL-2023]